MNARRWGVGFHVIGVCAQGYVLYFMRQVCVCAYERKVLGCVQMGGRGWMCRFDLNR